MCAVGITTAPVHTLAPAPIFASLYRRKIKYACQQPKNVRIARSVALFIGWDS